MHPRTPAFWTDKYLTDAAYSILQDPAKQAALVDKFEECMRLVPVFRKLANYKDVCHTPICSVFNR